MSEESPSPLERRLQNRLLGARLQLDYRISDNQQLRRRVEELESERDALLNQIRGARAELDALMATRTMRVARVPRAIYGRLRAQWAMTANGRPRRGRN